MHFGSALKRATLAVLSSLLVAGPPILAESQSTTKGAVLLVDTDDACRLLIDDEDKGVITPAQSQKFKVSHSSFFTLWTIRSKGFLYVGSTLAASILQFESTIRSNFAFSAGGCLRYRK